MGEMLKVVVDRAKWYRGQGSVYSQLLIIHQAPGDVTEGPAVGIKGKMCCLGFACLAKGFKTTAIAAMATPYTILSNMTSRANLTQEQVDWIKNTTFQTLIYANDSPLTEPVGPARVSSDAIYPRMRFLTEAEREAYLIEEGRKIGIDFEFIN